MPGSRVYFYAEGGRAPALEWLENQPDKVQDKVYFLVEQLQIHGSRLQRPYAAPLRDKIFELRARHLRVHYRVLYFFHLSAAVLACGCTKEGAVPHSDIERAKRARVLYFGDPKSHTMVI